MRKMLKKIGLSMMALFGLLALAPLNQAKAAVRFGVYVGAPACTYPVYRRYPVVPAPAYVYPSGGAWVGRDIHGRLDRGHDFHARGRR
jgi:hypothetical protein